MPFRPTQVGEHVTQFHAARRRHEQAWHAIALQDAILATVDTHHQACSARPAEHPHTRSTPCALDNMTGEFSHLDISRPYAQLQIAFPCRHQSAIRAHQRNRNVSCGWRGASIAMSSARACATCSGVCPSVKIRATRSCAARIAARSEGLSGHGFSLGRAVPTDAPPFHAP